ncbi:protease pro-enzyme activation domain-containing protein [Streptomyces sp. NPDC001406]|uniref:S53 family peptidase n=1 Tax=Streptomyces sp. NPDC001406 TaxID=3364572 RepID=UPI003689C956
MRRDTSPKAPNARTLAPALTAVWALATAVAAGLLPSPTAAAASPERQELTASRPAWTAAGHDGGALAATAPVDARVYLAGRDPAALAAYVRAVSDPHSPMHGKFLTPQQAAGQFGATASQISAVRNWLTRAGLTVTESTAHYLAVHGTVAAMNVAFGTSLHSYASSDGTYRAPSTSLSVPTAVRAAVLGVIGLDDRPVKVRTPGGAARQPSTSRTPVTQTSTPPPPTPPSVTLPPTPASPCSAYFGEKKATDLPSLFGHPASYAPCGYTLAQIRDVYGVTSSGLTGKGETVAVIAAHASPTIESDLNRWSTDVGLPPLTPGQLAQDLPAGGTTPDAGWSFEQTMDLEALHGMAPDARLKYVAAADYSSTALLDAVTRVVDRHLASIVSNSWTLYADDELPAATLAAFDQQFELGAVEGIGFYVASGDESDEPSCQGEVGGFASRPATAATSAPADSCHTTVEFPASDPWVTAVGATSLGINSHGRYAFETSWRDRNGTLSADGRSWQVVDEAAWGSAGGASPAFAQPYYQVGVVPDALRKPTGASAAERVVPDIAAFGDWDIGFTVGLTYQVSPGRIAYGAYKNGGTSLSAPLVAGLQVLAQQARRGIPIGFANPRIYARYGTAAYHDVSDHPFGAGTEITMVDRPRPGSPLTIHVLGHDNSLQALHGFDNATGVGSPSRS